SFALTVVTTVTSGVDTLSQVSRALAIDPTHSTHPKITQRVAADGIIQAPLLGPKQRVFDFFRGKHERRLVRDAGRLNLAPVERPTALLREFLRGSETGPPALEAVRSLRHRRRAPIKSVLRGYIAGAEIDRQRRGK